MIIEKKLFQNRRPVLLTQDPSENEYNSFDEVSSACLAGEFSLVENNMKKSLSQPQLSKKSSCLHLVHLGQVLRFKYDFTGAEKYLMEAITLASELGLGAYEAMGRLILGDVFGDQNNTQKSHHYYNTAEKCGIKAECCSGYLEMILLRRRGKYKASLAMAIDSGSKLDQGLALLDLGVQAQLANDKLLAMQHLKVCPRLFISTGAVIYAIRARYQLGLLHWGLHQSEAHHPPGETHLGKAWSMFVMAQGQALTINDVKMSAKIENAMATLAPLRFKSTPQVFATVDLQQKHDTAAKLKPAKGIIAHSVSMKNILRDCESYALTDFPVLVQGESGTGKELISRYLHDRSRRSQEAFVVVNCAAIPKDLFEREFFGHAKGAYTGAMSNSIGLVDQADGGTLMLDEVGELALELQAKLLRLLDNQTFFRVGDPNERRANIRIIAATNADLDYLVHQGLFRMDLLYRIQVLEVNLLPLRDRVEEILPLFEHLLSLAAGKMVVMRDYLNPAEIEALGKLKLRGNARELANLARRAIVRSMIEGGDDQPSLIPGIPSASRMEAGREPCRESLLETMTLYDGNKSKVADHFGVARTTLYRWLKKGPESAMLPTC